MTTTTTNSIRYEVTYYDARLSKRGRGVQTLRFVEYSAAVEFASKNKLYNKPCAIKVVGRHS